MFKFLKEKLGKAISVFSKKAESEAKEVEEKPQEKPVQKEIEKKTTYEHKEETRHEKKENEEKTESKRDAKEEPKKERQKKKEEPKERKQVHREEKKDIIKDLKEEPVHKKEAIELPKKEKKGFFGKIFGKKEERVDETKEETRKEEIIQKPEEIRKESEETNKPREEKKGLFQKIAERVTTTTISEKKFDKFFDELEMTLLENNVALEVVDKLRGDLKRDIVDRPLERGKVEARITKSLKGSIADLFDVPQIDLIERASQKKPFVIVFVGINGSGKTTTIAKIAKLYQKHGKKVVLAAADTFRSAAIQQLEIHGEKLGVKVIKHDYGSDPAAVAFDAIKHAESTGKDVVLIDTAGRLHSNVNLIDEMKKIVRVAKPDLVLFIGESITGNDCIEQAKKFNESTNLDGIILSKADVDEKGGTAISISHVIGKPILYLGTGQNYEDLVEFRPELIVQGLGLE